MATALAMATSTASAQGAERPWDIELTPYLWAAGIDADVRVNGRDGDIDMKFDDLFDAVDLAGSLLGVGRYGKFVTWMQLDYFSLDSDELDSDDQPQNGRLESDNFMGTLAFGYEFGDMRAKRAIDVLLGARYFEMDNELTLDAVGRFKKKRDIIDPVLIVRPSWRISERWRFNPTFSVGGGNDADLTYELQPQIQFQITDFLAARFGYRRVYYDVESNNELNKFDGTYHGFIIGLGGTFGGGGPVRVTQTAPEPAPQPMAMAPSPPPPPPPGDTDGDGIADNLDKCPSTGQGVQVDAVGCGFNTRIAVQFETNSAALTPQDKTELDRLVEVMKNTSTISGFVEGYTDSTGSAEYNKGLSQKRAEAVADYLIGNGISRDRVIPRGYGERNPVADNGTVEGRAENRRVVLKRVDADK